MSASVVDRVRTNPKYQQLVAKRSSFAWMLSFIMLGIYYGFILVIAFAPKTLGVKLGAGVMTLGIPVGVAVIVSAFVLTGIYVARANKEYDTLIKQIVEEAK